MPTVIKHSPSRHFIVASCSFPITMAITTGLSRNPVTLRLPAYLLASYQNEGRPSVFLRCPRTSEHPVPMDIFPCRQCRDGSITCALCPNASTPPNEGACVDAYGGGDGDHDDQHGIIDQTVNGRGHHPEHRSRELLRHEEKMDD